VHARAATPNNDGADKRRKAYEMSVASTLQPLTLRDKDTVTAALAKHTSSPSQSPLPSEMTFTGVLMYRRTQNAWYCRVPDNGDDDGGGDGPSSLVLLNESVRGGLIVRGDIVGAASVRRVLQAIPAITGWKYITAHTAEQLSELGYTVVRDRNEDDYVYATESLAKLTGNALMKKRHLANRAAAANPGAKLEPMTAAMAGDECLDLLRQWFQTKGNPRGDVCLSGEFDAACGVLQNWAALSPPLFGYVLRLANGRAVAYTVLERLAGTTAVCHFEKSDYAVDGAAQLLNRMVAERLLAAGFTHVNREQDLGDPGLRQAKESYKPQSMVEKYRCSIYTSPDDPDVFRCAPISQSPTNSLRH
jgi:hypothetical protein